MQFRWTDHLRHRQLAGVVWRYHSFPLRFREVEEMMLQRGIVVSHETVRQWCAKFEQTWGATKVRVKPAMG